MEPETNPNTIVTPTMPEPDAPIGKPVKKTATPLPVGKIVVVLAIVIVAIVAAVLGFLAGRLSSGETNTNSQNTAPNNNAVNTPPQNTTTKPQVFEPIGSYNAGDNLAEIADDFEVTLDPVVAVDGTTKFTGKVKGIEGALNIELYDDTKHLLGAVQTILPKGATTWEASLTIDLAPMTPNGILAFKATNIDSVVKDVGRATVKFAVQEVADKLKVFSPLKNQIVYGDPVKFRGEMTKVFEGTLGVKLLAADGKTIIHQDVITAAGGDVYTSYVEFTKDVDYKRIPAGAGPAGKWVIFEEDMSNGSEKVLVEIPVVFPV